MVAFKVIQVVVCLSLAISGNAVSLRGRKLITEAGRIKVGAKMENGVCVGGKDDVVTFTRKLIIEAECTKVGAKMENGACVGGKGDLVTFTRKLITEAECIKVGAKIQDGKRGVRWWQRRCSDFH